MCILNHWTKLHGLYYFTIIVCDHILYWRKNEIEKDYVIIYTLGLQRNLSSIIKMIFFFKFTSI
jgi:hypothetical protein